MRASLACRRLRPCGVSRWQPRCFSVTVDDESKKRVKPIVPLDYTDYTAVSNVASGLSKARLSGFVAITAFAGYAATGAPLATVECAAVTGGVFLMSAAANTLNQIREVDRDAKMMRTVNRAMPSQKCTRTEALGFAALSSTVGTAALSLCSPISAGLGAANLALYAGLYTGMKPQSEWNTWVGAVVGGVPPLIGWAAAGSAFDTPEPWCLAAALYLWQFPHFFALAWVHRVDYARGGFQMVPVNDPEGERTSKLIWNYSLYSCALPVVAVASGATSAMFAVEGAALNVALLAFAYKFKRDRSNENARNVFRITLAYLPLLLFFFVLHSKRLKSSQKDGAEETLMGQFKISLETALKPLRALGKAACPHEVIVADHIQRRNTNEELAPTPFCPAVSADQKADAPKAD
ncbi:UbiA prenyltransferase family-domain-containing protein [Pelagophyceae sp. CCMP2097]|nr:UbiA prenyltransferase family-domain-containing protein [Pelagophyceae sp. CCMP2097]